MNARTGFFRKKASSTSLAPSSPLPDLPRTRRAGPPTPPKPRGSGRLAGTGARGGQSAPGRAFPHCRLASGVSWILAWASVRAADQLLDSPPHMRPKPGEGRRPVRPSAPFLETARPAANPAGSGAALAAASARLERRRPSGARICAPCGRLRPARPGPAARRGVPGVLPFERPCDTSPYSRVSATRRSFPAWNRLAASLPRGDLMQWLYRSEHAIRAWEP